MDDLRWILLGVAVVVVAAIYFFSRARKKDQYHSPLDAANDMPSFSADDDLHNSWQDGVGPVRVVAGSEPENIPQQTVIEVNDGPVIEKTEEQKAVKEDKAIEDSSIEEPAREESVIDESATDESVREKSGRDDKAEDNNDGAIDDVISVYVLAPQNEAIKGEKILSASYALHLEHGDMKIFHRHSETANREIQFSMANIQEPGWFEVDEINQMETPGISFFMQVNLVENPSRVLDDMLICAHSMSTMLGVTLCNAQRKPLDEVYTSDLRDKVKRLAQIKEKSV